MHSISINGTAGRHEPAPIVAVSCNLTPGHFDKPIQTVFDPYLEALTEYAGVFPLLLPVAFPAAGNDEIDRHSLLARIDGLMLTGSRSMIHPEHYGAEAVRSEVPYDARRDARTLPLIRSALALGVPILGICRGAQEINCALGGSLHQAVQDVSQYNDHRAMKGLPDEQSKYLPRHALIPAPNGWLANLVESLQLDVTSLMVNSLHEQAIDQLGFGIVAEATADDGLVEAIRVDTAGTFAVGVQWHPEWHLKDNQLNRELFRLFGAACAARAGARISQSDHC